MSNQIRKEGQLISWRQDKGFGVIQVGGPDSLEKYFLHTKFIRSGTARPTIGQIVDFEVNPESPRKEFQLPAAIRVDVVTATVPTNQNERKIYLAGRVSKKDWRHQLVDFGDINSVDTWRNTTSRPMFDGNLCVGPFFIRCDHGCNHGSNTHGAGANKRPCNGAVTNLEVFQKALDGIKACDLFFVWAGADFNVAYGTLVEIGLARALDKKIIIAFPYPSACIPQWFALACAECVIDADPVSAYRRFVSKTSASAGVL